jgi:hypothetical protein
MSRKPSSSDSINHLSRRAFLRGLSVTASMPMLSLGGLAACQTGKRALQHQKVDDILDNALDIVFAAGQEHRGSTHVPMVAETLATLGRKDVIIGWVEQNLHDPGDGKNPQDFTRLGELSAQNWSEALGNERRRADWVEFFHQQISEGKWQTAVSVWTARLAPGIAAFAAHGVIRTAHAVRSLEGVESAQRKRELAEGLGLWAATFQRLPETPAKERGTRKPSAALSRVEPLPQERVRRGNIVAALTSLNDFPSFANVINQVDTSLDAASLLTDLTETFAGVYLANARDFASMITLVHAVTGTSAVRRLLPYVNAETGVSLLRYGWQLAAGLYAIRGGALPGKLPDSRLPVKDDLIDRAVKNSHAHPIKFTEACLREYAINPKPVYLFAAQHAIENLRG